MTKTERERNRALTRVEDLERVVKDLLNNETCSCAGTRAHPCPRCEVSLANARYVLKQGRDAR